MDIHVATVSQLSAHLRALRKARLLTQTDLGRLLGVKQSRIADIESDPGSISVTQLHRVLSALGAQMFLRDSGGGWQPAESGPGDPGAVLRARTSRASGSAVAPAAMKVGQHAPVKRTGKASHPVGAAGAVARLSKKSRGTW
jgi:HTH-type transcriptional regulator / antitoxin HipB